MGTKKYLLIFILVAICLQFYNGLSEAPKDQNQNENEEYRTKKTKFDNKKPLRDRTWKNPQLPLWSKTTYGGYDKLPSLEFKPLRSYPMIYLDINNKNQVVAKGTNRVIKCKILNFILL